MKKTNDFSFKHIQLKSESAKRIENNCLKYLESLREKDRKNPNDDRQSVKKVDLIKKRIILAAALCILIAVAFAVSFAVSKPIVHTHTILPPESATTDFKGNVSSEILIQTTGSDVMLSSQSDISTETKNSTGLPTDSNDTTVSETKSLETQTHITPTATIIPTPTTSVQTVTAQQTVTPTKPTQTQTVPHTTVPTQPTRPVSQPTQQPTQPTKPTQSQTVPQTTISTQPTQPETQPTQSVTPPTQSTQQSTQPTNISSNTEPTDNEMPSSAYLSSKDIVKLVSMDQTDRKAITSYIQSAALLDDESCEEFTDILYSTDIITVDGKLPRSIIYYPETKDLTVMYTVSSSTHWYIFEYILNDGIAENRLNTVINTENAVTYNEKLKLLCIPEIEDKDIAKHNSYCWVQINGKLAKGTYCNKNEEITNDVWDSMFSSEVIISPLLKVD